MILGARLLTAQRIQLLRHISKNKSFKQNFYIRLKRTTAISLTGVLFFVSACQTTNQFTESLGLSGVSQSDACGNYSTSLRESKGYFQRNLVKSVLVGAIGGAVLGAVFGGKKAALAGALAGGAIGASVGYWDTQQKEHQDRASLSQSVYADSQRETREITHALSYFTRVRTCRLQHTKSIKSRYKSGSLSREKAMDMLDLERRRYADDIIVVQAIGAEIDKRHNELMGAAHGLSKNSSTARTYIVKAEKAEKIDWGNVYTPSTGKMVSAKSTVNVRSLPSTNGHKVALLRAGQDAEELEPSNKGWTKIKMKNGTTGYTSTQFLNEARVRNAPQLQLASLTRSLPSSADIETRTVGILFEGREKRIDLARLQAQAQHDEETAFVLD
ncbi:MAG: SH3 domain-containing protein [Magnetovibrio sp.]|nr:SH3 domain-containing protein [Magnetovibrio sp.]